MAKSKTHNEIVLRPPPGTRFTIFGSDVHLEFQRGREREIVTWLRTWIDSYIEPEALKAEAIQGEDKTTKFQRELAEAIEDLENNPQS